MTIPDTVIKQAIERDAVYVGNVARDFVDPKNESFAPIVSFCLVPYLSLFVYESYQKLKTSDPALAALVSSDVESIFTRSRHSLKLFEDTHRGIAGQLDYFRDEVLPAFRSRFIEKIPRLLRFFGKDLGLFTYDSRLVTTNHGATFHMGIPPRDLLVKTGPETRAIYEEYGRYFGHLGASLGSGNTTFVTRLDPRLFNSKVHDVRANDYYRSVFDGANNPDLNALLVVFRGMMNFVDSVISIGENPGAVSYTVFKIRFLTLYQVLGSLQVLHDEQLRTLTPRSAQFVKKIIDAPEARLIMARPVKPFRNTLMHYNLNPRVDLSRVDLNDPLFGLVPIYFPSHTLTSFAALIDQSIADTAAAMDTWAA